jgi:L-iditol 2-dehydrogenase
VEGLTKLAPGAGAVALSERPEPVAGRGHVVLDVVATGICGTDLHITDGKYPSVPPVTMGHEVSGVVAAVGDGVDARWLGARVATETYFSVCGRCASCRAGRINLCLERKSIGTHVDGGFAPRVLLPVRGLHRVPDRLEGHVAALLEPLACVCHSLLDPPRVGAGDEVLVVGPGPIGLLAAQVARACGGRVHVRGAERDASRLECAAALGFPVSSAGAEDGAAVGADVVVECSGAAAGMAFALESARRGGRYVQIGLAGKPVSLPFDEICLRELEVSSGFASTPASWRRALALVEDGRVELEPLLSEVVPLAEWERAFAATRAGDGIKYVLAP